MISRSGRGGPLFSVVLLFSLVMSRCALAFTIVIDPGHGGAEKGAVYENIVEKDLCLAVSRAIRTHLLKRPGMRVVLTRDDDVTVSWEDRARVIEDANPDLVVSLHFNTDMFMLAETRGLEIYYPADDFSRPPQDAISLFSRNNRSFAVGKFLRDRYLRSSLFSEWKHDLNLFAQRDLKIFRITANPILLLELAYLTSPDDRSRIVNGQFLADMARFLAEAIFEWAAEK